MFAVFAAAASLATTSGLLLDVLNETRVVLREERERLDALAALSTEVRGRMLSGAKRRRRAGMAGAEKKSPRLLLVLGVISNPRTPHTRDWIRETYMASALAEGKRQSKRVLLRFVMGKRGLTASDQSKLAAEQQRHGDLEHIDASDFGDRGGIFSCIDKLFAWFPHAVAAFPGASFYAKADDDSYVDVRRLLRMLAPLRPVRNAYLGYVQYDSFITDEWKHCGWAAGPVGAAHAHKHGCPHQPEGKSYGPFPFVVGALTVMGADLAGWMRSSTSISGLVAAGRASQAEPRKHWDCGYSDVTLGYALARSNLSVSLVSVRHAMRDLTYGAMAAKNFVVAHHLRTQKQFAQAHADALAAANWEPQSAPCVAWPDAAAPQNDGSSEGAMSRRDRANLRSSMAAFGCCQQWSLCEVTAPQ